MVQVWHCQYVWYISSNHFDEVHFKVRVPAFALDLSDGQHLGPGGRNYPHMVDTVFPVFLEIFSQ